MKRNPNMRQADDDYSAIVGDIELKEASLMDASKDDINDEDDNSWEPLATSCSSGVIPTSTNRSGVAAAAAAAAGVTSSSSFDKVSNPRKFPKANPEENSILVTTRKLFQKSSSTSAPNSNSNNKKNDEKFSPFSISLKFAYYFLPQMCLQNSHYILGYILVTTGTILHALSVLLYAIQSMIFNRSLWLFVYLPLISTSILFQWHTALLQQFMTQLNRHFNNSGDNTTAVDAIVKSCHTMGIFVWILPALLEVHTYYCVFMALSQCENLWFQLLSCSVIASFCYYYLKEAATFVTTEKLTNFMKKLRFLLHIFALISLIIIDNTTTKATSVKFRMIQLLPFILIFIGTSLQQQQKTTTWMLECSRHAVRLTIRDVLQELLITLANSKNNEAPVEELLQLVMMRWIVEYWTTIATSSAATRRSSNTNTSSTNNSGVVTRDDDDDDDDDDNNAVENSSSSPIPFDKDNSPTVTPLSSVLGWEEMRSMLSTTADIMMEEVSENELLSSSNYHNVGTSTLMQDQYFSSSHHSSSSAVCSNELSCSNNNSEWVTSRQRSTSAAPCTVARIFSDDLDSSSSASTRQRNTTASSLPFTDLQSMLFSFDVDQRARPAVLAYKHFVHTLPPSRNVAFFVATITKLPCTLALLLGSSILKTYGMLLWGTLPLLPLCIIEVYLVHLWIKTTTASYSQISVVESEEKSNNTEAYLPLPQNLDSIDILFASIDSEGGEIVLKKHSLFHVYRNMQRSVEALEMGLLVARAAQTTALAMGFASSIIHLTEFRHELNQGWCHGVRLLLTELLEYQELQKQKDTIAHTTSSSSTSGGKYATAAHIMIRNSHLVAKNVSIMQQDHPVVSEMIACVTGVVSHILLTAAGRGWFWGKDEELTKLDSIQISEIEKTHDSRSYSINERIQGENCQNSDDMSVESSRDLNTELRVKIGTEYQGMRADISRDLTSPFGHETICSETTDDGAYSSAQTKGKKSEAAGEKDTVDSILSDVNRNSDANRKATDIYQDVNRRVLSVQAVQEASDIASVKGSEDPLEHDGSQVMAVDIVAAGHKHGTFPHKDFSYDHQWSIMSDPGGSVRGDPKFFVATQQTESDRDKNSAKEAVVDLSIGKMEINDVGSKDDDLGLDPICIKSPSSTGYTADDDDPEEEAFGWTHISHNNLSLNIENAVDEDNWQQLSPSNEQGDDLLTSRQVVTFSTSRIETDLQPSSADSVRLNPMSLVRMVLSQDRVARRRSNTRTESETVASTTRSSESPEWGPWVGGGLAIVGAAAVGAVSLSTMMNDKERMGNNGDKEATSFRIEEIPNDDVAEEIDEENYKEKMVF